MDYERIYTLYEIEIEKPEGYIIIEKNHPPEHGTVSWDRYKVIHIEENIVIYNKITPYTNTLGYAKGAIIVEMVAPEE